MHNTEYQSHIRTQRVRSYRIRILHYNQELSYHHRHQTGGQGTEVGIVVLTAGLQSTQHVQVSGLFLNTKWTSSRVYVYVCAHFLVYRGLIL